MAELKLLIVDDEASMRSALTRALRCQDRDITLAADGAEAVAILERQLPAGFSVAIVDVCMPRMDGLELLVEIKRRSPATQILMLTGKSTVADAVRAMRLGADDFLEKPFDPDALRERIRIAQRLWKVKRAPPQSVPTVDPIDGFQNLLGDSPCREAHPSPGSALGRQRRYVVDSRRERHGEGAVCPRRPFQWRAGAQSIRCHRPSIDYSVCRLNVPHCDNAEYGCVTISVGVAFRDAESVETPAEALIRADQALYAAKRNGRNRVEVAARCASMLESHDSAVES